MMSGELNNKLECFNVYNFILNLIILVVMCKCV